MMSAPVVLCACEESGTCCKAWREAGFNAWSCDILDDPSTPLPDYHVIGDVMRFFSGYDFDSSGRLIPGRKPFDLVLAFPPCTYLTKSGNRAFFHPEVNIPRFLQRSDAARFFLLFFGFNTKHLCVENPVGVMSHIFRKPDCIVSPYRLCEDGSEMFSKETCLWLRNLPPLVQSPKVYTPGRKSSWTDGKSSSERSVLSWSLARAMANQWIDIISR